MVATTARRAVLPALLALAALLALPNAAGAALNWGSCVDFRGVQVRHADRPARSRGRRPRHDRRCGSRRVGQTVRPDADVPVRRPRRRGSERDAERRLRAARARGSLPADRLRPARHRPLRPAALPAAGEATRTCATPRAAEDCANRLGVARKHYTTPDSVEDMEAIRAQLGVEKLTLFGISYGTELAIAVRARLPAARRAADPRLGRRPRRHATRTSRRRSAP